MRSVRGKAVLLLLGGLVALGLLALAWVIDSGSSEAQQDAMYNCPQAGRWAISVWSGQNGTDTGEALATCGDPGVDLAYYIDPDTQQWLGYFVGRADISTLPTLNDKQGVIVRGSAAATSASLAIPGATYTGTTSQDKLLEFEVSADGLGITKVRYKVTGTEPGGAACDRFTSSTVDAPIEDNSFSIARTLFDMSGHFETQWQATGEITVHEPWSDIVLPCNAGPLTWTATVPSATPVPTLTPPSGPGQLDNCPQPNRWAISVWNGPDGVDTQTALATCGAVSVAAAYHLDPQTQGWARWFAGRPEMTTLTALDSMQAIITLGGAAVPTPTPTPSPTPSPTPTATPTATPTGQYSFTFGSFYDEPDTFQATVEEIRMMDSIPDPSGAVTPPAGGQFAVVLMAVTNIGNEAAQPANSSFFRLRDDQGQVFHWLEFAELIEAQIAAEDYFERQGGFDIIMPGITLDMVFVFLVPEGTTGLVAERCPDSGC